MLPNLKPTQRVALLTTVDPQSATTVQRTGWIDASGFSNLLAVLSLGTISATGTVDAKLEQATDNSGTGAKDVAGKAITQMTQAGGSSNKQALINCKSTDLDFANGFKFVRFSITPATAAALIAAGLYGLDARYEPAAQSANVAQVVG